MDTTQVDENEVCPEGPQGFHRVDWSTARPAEDMPGVIDFECKFCGRSGSAQIAPSDINW